jgi:hypothetical protein
MLNIKLPSMLRSQQPWRLLSITFAALILAVGLVGISAGPPVSAQEAPAGITPNPMPATPETETPPAQTPLPPEPAPQETAVEPVTIVLLASGLATLGAGIAVKRRHS